MTPSIKVGTNSGVKRFFSAVNFPTNYVVILGVIRKLLESSLGPILLKRHLGVVVNGGCENK